MLNLCIKFLPIVAAYFVTSFAKCSDFDDLTRYAIPEPKIEVFAQGFRVSIPDQEGIALFAFHANINVPLPDIRPGQFNEDIVNKKDDHWVFEYTRKKLKVGDVIYYWFFVERFNLGFRYSTRKFVVKEIVPYTSLKTDSKPTPASPGAPNMTNSCFFEQVDKFFGSNQKCNQTNSSSDSDSRNEQNPIVPTDRIPISTCCQLFLNISTRIALLSDQVDKLTEGNKILREIVQKNDHNARTLRVFGKYPSEYYPTPQDFVQTLISEKLRLVGVEVLEAKQIPENGVSFTVKTVTDKVNIILAAQEKLKGSNYELS